jgi:hypothetical protein
MFMSKKNTVIALMVMPALVAGIASCNRKAEAETAVTDTVFWQKRRKIPVREYPKQEVGIDPNAPAPVYYSIPHLGNADGHPLELELTFSTVSDTVFGNYIEEYDPWGGMGHSLSGKISNGTYNLKVDNYGDLVGYLKLTGSGKGYTVDGTYKCTDRPRAKQITAAPALNVDQNPQLHYTFKLNARPLTTQDLDLPVAALKPYSILNEITVYSPDSTPLQILGFEETIIEGNSIITLKDFNFDGYLDMAVQVRYPTMPKGDWGNIYFLYNSQSGLFTKSETLSHYDWFNVYYGPKQLLHGYADGNRNDSEDTYVWHNDSLLRIARVYTLTDDRKIYHEEYTVQNGKSILTKEYTE